MSKFATSINNESALFILLQNLFLVIIKKEASEKTGKASFSNLELKTGGLP